MRFCFRYCGWHASKFGAHGDCQPLTAIGGTDVIETGSLILYTIPFLCQSDSGISLMNQFILQMTSTVAVEDS